MPALVAGIHVLLFVKDVDGRDKPGHDVVREVIVTPVQFQAAAALPLG